MEFSFMRLAWLGAGRSFWLTFEDMLMMMLIHLCCWAFPTQAPFMGLTIE
jgi:hypothetical protein